MSSPFINMNIWDIYETKHENKYIWFYKFSSKL